MNVHGSAANRVAVPDSFAARLRAEIGAAEAAALLDSLHEPPSSGLRAHRDAAPVSALLKRLGWRGETLPWAPEGARLSATAPLAGARGAGRHPATLHPWQDAGAYYLQDPSAMGVVPVLDPRPGARVLDLAAAPGGKSTFIADRLAGAGLLWAHDLDARRVDDLVGNLERWGAANAVVSHGPVERLAPLAGTFDAVLLDAPCSAEGLFRRSAAARRSWSLARVAEFARLQGRLLDVAADLLRPGGVLVYSTCTFSLAENEEQVAALLARRGDLCPEPFDLPGPDRGLSVPGAPEGLEAASARWWPQRHAGEGHFVAKLRRDAGASSRAPRLPASSRRRRAARATAGDLASPSSDERAALSSFLEDLTGGQTQVEDESLELRGRAGRLWLVPRDVALHGVQPRRVGVPLGEVRKGRFEPHHAFSRLPLGRSSSARRLDLALDDPRLVAYLRGETLSAAVEDGWLLVCAGGLALGWAKAKRREINNHYPKGLRRARGD